MDSFLVNHRSNNFGNYVIQLLVQDFGDDCSSECESDDEVESGEDCASESEDENENSATNEEWTSSGESKSDCSEIDEADVEATAEAALKKLIPCNIEEFEKVCLCILL